MILSATGTAASHVLLTAQTPGYFTDNALMALHPCLPVTLTFIPASSLQQPPTPSAFLSGLRVESLFHHQFGVAMQSDDADDQPTRARDDTNAEKRTPHEEQPQPRLVKGSSRVFNGTVIGGAGGLADNHTASAPAPAPAAT